MNTMFGLSKTVIEEICHIFGKHTNIDEVVIFGSRAKGNYTEGSDIDLAIKGNNLSSKQLMDLYIQIEDTGILYKVDLVDYNQILHTPLSEHIDRVGKLFYKK